jgi:hypothetical protein
MNYLLYNCLLLLIIITCAYKNSISNNIEMFTPKIKEIYRPVIRNVRLEAEGFYNKHSSNMSNLFRRFGVM